MVIDCEVITFMRLRQHIKLEKKDLLKNTNNTDRLQKQLMLPEYK